MHLVSFRLSPTTLHPACVLRIRIHPNLMLGYSAATQVRGPRFKDLFETHMFEKRHILGVKK